MMKTPLIRNANSSQQFVESLLIVGVRLLSHPETMQPEWES